MHRETFGLVKSCKTMIEPVSRLFARFRYPVSRPEDLSLALGIPLSSSLSFDHIASSLTTPGFYPKKLTKYMPRSRAEAAFSRAVRCDRFHYHTLAAFYINGSWLQFRLGFDKQNRLNSLAVHHRDIGNGESYELPLPAWS